MVEYCWLWSVKDNHRVSGNACLFVYRGTGEAEYSRLEYAKWKRLENLRRMTFMTAVRLLANELMAFVDGFADPARGKPTGHSRHIPYKPYHCFLRRWPVSR